MTGLEEINYAEMGKLLLEITSTSDQTNIGNPKANFTINANLQPNGASAIPVGNISLIAIDGASYLKIDNISMPDTIPYPGLNIADITGKWLKIDQDSITALLQAGIVQVPLDISQTQSPELTKQVVDLFAVENIVSFDKKLSDEVVSGQDTNHYSVKINSQKLKDAINKTIDLAKQNQASIKSAVSSVIDSLGVTSAEIWIGKNDLLLYKVKLDKTIDLSTIYPLLSGQVNIKFTVLNSDFNKPITVQAPTDSQKLEKIIAPLIKISKVGINLSQIGSLAQTAFITNENSYSSLCFKGLLNGYLKDFGGDLVNLNNDIVAQGAKKPVCLSTTQNFCISTQLEDGSYLCVDKNNILGTTRCVSSTTVCE